LLAGVLVYNMGVAVLLGWAGSWWLTYVIDDSYPTTRPVAV
jgi:hypothetical protein